MALKTGTKVNSCTEPAPSVLVCFWDAILRVLRSISPYSLLSWVFCLSNSSTFTEVWAVFNSILAGAMVVVVHTSSCSHAVGLVIIGYAGIRVCELVIYLVNVVLFDPFRARPYRSRNGLRLSLLLLHNYAETVLWFAVTLTLLDQWSLLSLSDTSFWGVLRTAFVGMVSLALDTVRPLGATARVVLLAQACVGAFLTLLTLARLVSLIPAEAQDECKESGVQSEPNNPG